jgi:hypothetical protein
LILPFCEPPALDAPPVWDTGGGFDDPAGGEPSQGTAGALDLRSGRLLRITVLVPEVEDESDQTKRMAPAYASIGEGFHDPAFDGSGSAAHPLSVVYKTP